MKPRQKRIALIAGGLASIALAAVLTLNALDSNIALYVTPTEVLAGKAPQGKAFRIGGLVKEGSVKRQDMTVRFIITDTAKEKLHAAVDDHMLMLQNNPERVASYFQDPYVKYAA